MTARATNKNDHMQPTIMTASAVTRTMTRATDKNGCKDNQQQQPQGQLTKTTCKGNSKN